jgi:hypothetical protein
MRPPHYRSPHPGALLSGTHHFLSETAAMMSRSHQGRACCIPVMRETHPGDLEIAVVMSSAHRVRVSGMD